MHKNIYTVYIELCNSWGLSEKARDSLIFIASHCGASFANGMDLFVQTAVSRDDKVHCSLQFCNVVCIY